MPLSPAARRSLIPHVILLASLVLTGGATYYATQVVGIKQEANFRNEADRIRAAIVSRLDAYLAMLHGGAGLFAASTQVRWPEFRAYVERLEIQKRYPGIQGIGFSRFIRDDEKAHVESVIKAHIPTFEYWAFGPSPEFHAITFLEPQNPANIRAMGLNMFSEPVRREAMARARDEGTACATGPVTLVQEAVEPPSHRQTGFLIYEPVYRSGGIPATVEERRADLFGFVYSPFRADDLFAGILGHPDDSTISFAVYDGAETPGNLIHQTGEMVSGSPFSETRTTDLAGRKWVLSFRSIPGVIGESERAIVYITAASGTVLSLLLFAVTRAQIRARANAERTSEELRKSEEALRGANQSKDEFLAIVSHELRTPLNAVVGWAAMLRRGQVPKGSETHALEVIERNALAQARLVEDLLDISRAVAGRLRLENADVDVKATLGAALDAVKPAAAANHIDLAFDAEGDLGVMTADPARIQQVFQNLLSNAIKFTKAGGKVVLQAARDAGDITVRVRDTGIGIPPAFLPFVFDPFRQADTSTTRSHSGVGLGLAIARHLVELHGGSIQVASDGIGQGSTFTVHLKAAGQRTRKLF